VDRWANENELHHKVFISPSDQPENLVPSPPDGTVACVWDLQLIWFERNAWVEKVLGNTKGPDLTAYLGRRLEDQA
jgi:hypothetical protein